MLKKAKSVFFILCLTGLMFQYVNCAEDIEGGFFEGSSVENFNCGDNCGGQKAEFLKLAFTAGEIQILPDQTKSIITGYCNNGGYENLELLLTDSTGRQERSSILCRENRFFTEINFDPTIIGNSVIPGTENQTFTITLQLVAVDGATATNDTDAIIQVPFKRVSKVEVDSFSNSSGIL